MQRSVEVGVLKVLSRGLYQHSHTGSLLSLTTAYTWQPWLRVPGLSRIEPSILALQETKGNYYLLNTIRFEVREHVINAY